MYAIIKTGGKQYKVTEGDYLNVDKLSKDPKETVELDVIAVNDGKTLITGADVKSTVTAEVIVEGRDKKVIIYKKRRRKDSKLKRGFRRSFTRLKITKIAL
ncbi:MAG TPA: 50S ribosomal protein L21 [Arcobacter sp.]|nr:50S ribosomal protein L21 [Arcobacter sp.]HIP56345.1 50S ribosomal protein L21 [Arcobacter sp.]